MNWQEKGDTPRVGESQASLEVIGRSIAIAAISDPARNLARVTRSSLHRDPGRRTCARYRYIIHPISVAREPLAIHRAQLEARCREAPVIIPLAGFRVSEMIFQSHLD